jgi:hypothetical protein
MKEIGQVGGLHPRPDLKVSSVKPSVHLVSGTTVLVQLDFIGPSAVDDAMLMIDRIAIEMKRGHFRLEVTVPLGSKITETEHC